ncbi:MAG: Arc family DNA-binding protein [Methylocystis sp.]|uniref:Arc family DNA-binding protein n=1 Tax=Methylocystis sp. TaxID=1911079 RepID=UPI003DA66B0B
MSREPTIHIRLRVPATLLAALKERAEDNVRSLNQEAVHIFRNFVANEAKAKASRRGAARSAE